MLNRILRPFDKFLNIPAVDEPLHLSNPASRLNEPHQLHKVQTAERVSPLMSEASDLFPPSQQKLTKAQPGCRSTTLIQQISQTRSVTRLSRPMRTARIATLVGNDTYGPLLTIARQVNAISNQGSRQPTIFGTANSIRTPPSQQSTQHHQPHNVRAHPQALEHARPDPTHRTPAPSPALQLKPFCS